MLCALLSADVNNWGKLFAVLPTKLLCQCCHLNCSYVLVVVIVGRSVEWQQWGLKHSAG